jgi:hypothetical protein
LPILQSRGAHGEAPAVSLECAETLAIAPLDDSIDSNLVRIEGGGTIASFGEGPIIDDIEERRLARLAALIG